MPKTSTPRLPHSIRLPFGFVIPIRYRTQAQMVKIGLGSCHGAWDAGERAIYVCRDDHVAEQAETIAHELLHAANDYRHWVDQCIRIPLQMQSAETAMELSSDE